MEEAARQAASLRFVNRGITAPRARARRSHLVCVILSPIPRELLRPALDRFMAGLGNPFARAVFCQIRATSADRATGAEAERHRRAALLVARSFGIAIHPEGTRCSYNWDGAALNGATEAYVILHEIAHFALAPPERRRLIDFGLGPGPDTIDRDAAEIAEVLSLLAREEDEARASLLGIVWEAQLAQPALASFLDQNWLEGLDRSAASHFSTVSTACAGMDCSASRYPANSIGRRPLAFVKLLEPKPESRAASGIPRPSNETRAHHWGGCADLRNTPALRVAPEFAIAYPREAILQLFHSGSPR